MNVSGQLHAAATFLQRVFAAWVDPTAGVKALESSQISRPCLPARNPVTGQTELSRLPSDRNDGSKV
jgi:hypothetical protein